MHQWGANSLDPNSSPTFVAQVLSVGSGAANKAANNTALYQNSTIDAFKSHIAAGDWGVTSAQMANVTSEGPSVSAPGWNTRKVFEGPIVSVTASGGSAFANGETAKVTGGSSNGLITLTSNATGGLVSGVVTTSGLLANTTAAVVAFNREQHLANVTVTGTTSGFSNTDTILVSNGTVNATASISTNSTGGITNSSFTITNVGLFSNTTANADLVVTALANTGANSAGTGATFAGKLATSANGTIALTLGGRAGRVQYECLAEVSSLSSNTSALP